MKYINYTYKELLQDDYFLNSQINPTDENIRFWNNLTDSDETLALEVRKARNILRNIPFRQKDLSSDKQLELLNKINRSIRENKKKRSIKNFRIIISAAACIALLCLFGLPYYIDSFSNDKLSAIEKIKKPSQPVTQIQLIQADNTGLTIEGEESVIHYDDKGTLSINSEKMSGDKKSSAAVHEKPTQPQYHQLIVPSGKISFLALSDGTKVWVNANTRVVYPETFEANKREIYVEGEIYLEVSQNKERPFIVKTNRLDVNVLGTSFNVSAYEDDEHTAVVLVTGKVNIRTKNNKQADLMPNDMLQFENGRIEKTQVNVKNHISWHKGTYIFDKEQFSVILNKLSRYYGKEIVWNREMENLHCTGTLNLKDNIYKLLEGLEAAVPVTFTEKNEKIYVHVKPEKQ